VSDKKRPAVRVGHATFVGGAQQVEQLPPPLHSEVAFAGRSNVGKSSLLNCMLERKRLVRTSSDPGCTRMLNVFRAEVHVDDAPPRMIDFVDLPGYGYAKRSRTERRSWEPMIDGFLRTRAGLACVCVLIDVRRGLQEDDRDLLTYLDDLERPWQLVATKLDELARSKRKPALETIRRDAGRRAIGFSAYSGDGRDELWRTLLARLG
jgi:GTP-binding protein